MQSRMKMDETAMTREKGEVERKIKVKGEG
jgi:hypothetical protein